ncbi:MAG: penicillin-binding protein 2 [Arenimonas sp.]|nr:penicillin-binding protein 2 [Arenimonas sp.]
MRPMPRAGQPRVRLGLIVGILLFCGTVVVARAAYMQLWAEEKLQAAGDERFLREVTIATTRGMITDRNGEPLAVSSPVESLWVNPKELLVDAKRVPELARAVGLPVDELTLKLAQRKDKQFMYLRRHMNPDAAKAVLDLDIPGVYSSREFRRFYPHREVMAQVIGFTNLDEHGIEGMEKAFDDWLTGTPGKQKIIRDRRGRVVENVDLIRPAENGKDLVLSIDRRIQYLAYSELKKTVLQHQARSGTAVVLDVKTGEVLAMVNYPSYNPNSRENIPPSRRRNAAVTDVLEPGSTMKPFTVAAALENGIDPDIVIPTGPGKYRIANRYISDVHDYGPVTLRRLLVKSSNIGSAKLAATMSNQHMYGVFSRFGFGEKTESGFPGESSAVLSAPNRWGPVEKATISYGYGLSVTPLQIAQAYATLANGGVRVSPTFIKGAKTRRERAVDARIANDVLHMLEGVIEPGGTATQAAIKGYRVAGKTGTSRRAVAGGYERRYISLFAGVVPIENPRFAMAVVVHEPSAGGYYGGVISAPVFHHVMDGALRLMDVPPDNIAQWYADRVPAKPAAPVAAEEDLPPVPEVTP